MGYRSEVAYVIGFDTVELREQFIALVTVHDDEYVRNALNECETKYERPIITFHAQDVKWYPSYADVQGHYKLREYAVEWFDGKSGWVAQELGEDGQTEYDYGGEGQEMDLDSYIYVRHSMELDFPNLLADVNKE